MRIYPCHMPWGSSQFWLGPQSKGVDHTKLSKSTRSGGCRYLISFTLGILSEKYPSCLMCYCWWLYIILIEKVNNDVWINCVWYTPLVFKYIWCLEQIIRSLYRVYKWTEYMLLLTKKWRNYLNISLSHRVNGVIILDGGFLFVKECIRNIFICPCFPN